MVEEYLLGMSRDATIGFLLGSGLSMLLFIGVFWIAAVLRHWKRPWR